MTDKKEILDTIEETIDITEKTLDEIERHKNLLIPVAVGCGVAGLLVGGYFGYRHAKKRFNTLLAEEIEKEREEVKAFYARMYKKEEFATPEGAAESIGVGVPVEAADALLKYQGKLDAEPEDERPPAVAVVVEESVHQNIFQKTSTYVWNQDAEDEYRATIDADVPYVISEEEWAADEMDFQKVNLTYYAGDGVLADEDDEPIPGIDKVIGAQSITRFGHGTDSDRVVFVRNHKMGVDFEINKHDGKFSEEVAGLKHSDYPMRHPNRHRVADDE